MLIATNLKISSRCMSQNDKQILIDNILDTLHLTHAKDTRCRNLSGGQKVIFVNFILDSFKRV